MELTTKMRAYAMLQNDPLTEHKHLPAVYAVGERLFFMKHAAEAWHKEVDRCHPVETVTIMEAYGAQEMREMPKGINVRWKIETITEAEKAMLDTSNKERINQ